MPAHRRCRRCRLRSGLHVHARPSACAGLRLPASDSLPAATLTRRAYSHSRFELLSIGVVCDCVTQDREGCAAARSCAAVRVLADTAQHPSPAPGTRCSTPTNVAHVGCGGRVRITIYARKDECARSLSDTAPPPCVGNL